MKPQPKIIDAEIIEETPSTEPRKRNSATAIVDATASEVRTIVGEGEELARGASRLFGRVRALFGGTDRGPPLPR